ncbi:putative aminotransferase-like, plant mobile domain-containing protein [Medicago truncatula]|uniref:Putative aminotransferase-like, plant mobile domain-containing protein n=1 Tax=Medicago truncatula TaxID=3880 RepID=A0A396HAT6_MEDTR|nr:putative aminotransferase-like, plant mobile domain-containing protein [Medicago truncatula]
MDELDSWTWGGMRLAFLYEQLSLTSDSFVVSCGGYMTLLVGCTLANFSNIIPRIDDDAYNTTVSPLVSQWKPPRDFSNPGHYRAAIDSLDHSHVTWRPYETRRHITPFEDICCGFLGSTGMSRLFPGLL